MEWDRCIHETRWFKFAMITDASSNLFVWASVLLLCSNCTGTSIFILTDTHKIVVAADSKVYDSTEKLCKVFRSGAMYWAMSGQINAFGQYDVPELIAKSQKEGHTIKGTFVAFQDKIMVPLKREKEREDQVDKGLSKKLGAGALSISFFGFESGHAVIARLEILWDLDLSTSKKKLFSNSTIVVDGKCSTGNPEACATSVGTHTEAERYYATHPNWPQNLVGSGIAGIIASIHEDGDIVGPPIRVWTITQDNKITSNQNSCDVKSSPPGYRPPARPRTH